MVTHEKSHAPFDSDAAASADLADSPEYISPDALADRGRANYSAGYMQADNDLAHRIRQLEDSARFNARDAHLFIGQIRIVEGDDAL